MTCADDTPVSPETPDVYLDLPRRAWADLAATSPVPLGADVLAQVRGLGDPTSEDDVREVFHPLTELILRYAANLGLAWADWNAYLRLDVPRVPFIVAVAGSVAVGKSTVARLLTELLRRSSTHPHVELVTTDGFLMPNAILEARGILDRKG
ncbi:MAG: type I pantothenate kinase, partial [Actinomycetia bacterium]|nr:type I pantothenate kinase [Actinomycetes bacterium]